MSARDPLQELEEALSFPVSQDFCARVRQQLAAEPVGPRMFGAWRLAAAAVVVLAAGTGLITTFRGVGVNVAQVSGPRIADTPKMPVPQEYESAVVIEPVRVPQRFARVAASGGQARFETVVPDDQLRALDRLLAAMREGRATVPPLVADVELNDRGERTLRALVIEPVTVALLAGTPAEPNKNPVKDPNK